MNPGGGRAKYLYEEISSHPPTPGPVGQNGPVCRISNPRPVDLEFQFGIGCLSTAPTLISNESQDYPLLDDIAAGSPPSIKPQAPKPPKPKTITPIKPPTPDQLRIKQLQANVDRQRDALKRERENQKLRREAEQRRRELSGF